MRWQRSSLVLVAFGVLSISAAAHAQQAGGSALQGRVLDQQEAVLPGVTVLITNQDNGTFRETITSSDGTYFATGLQPGRYRITAELSGFKKFTREGIGLLLGSTQTVEIRLEVGGVAETVTVTGEAPPVDLTSSKVGGSNNQVTFVLDGGNNTDDNSASASGAQARTPLEAVEEFQVQTNQFDVEFGRTTGGVVNAITKRGTNTFRGSAFGYLTNSGMTAETLFAKQAGTGKAETDKHQYGGTFGGPILRDKIHFFGSYERYVLGTGMTNVFPTRPDLNWRIAICSAATPRRSPAATTSWISTRRPASPTTASSAARH